MANDRQTRADLGILESLELGTGEARALLDKAHDPAYWRSLLPSPAPNGRAAMREARPLTADDVSRAHETLDRAGYFQTEPVLAEDDMARMCGVVERLRAEGWPPVFSFVYDEPWMAFRGPSIRHLLEAHLGPDYRQNANLWTYYVAPRRGARGWPPHVDSGDEQRRVTIWIPLSDATVHNGCMYVLPKDRVPASMPADYRGWSAVARGELTQLLQAAQALPAGAGSILGWAHDVVHWGSVVGEARGPRISVAAEFVPEGLRPDDGELPLLHGQGMPTHAERMHVIAKALTTYASFEPGVAQYAPLARELLGACPALKP